LIFYKKLMTIELLRDKNKINLNNKTCWKLNKKKNKKFVKCNNLKKQRNLIWGSQTPREILREIQGLSEKQVVCQIIRIKTCFIYRTKILKLKQALTHLFINLLSMSFQLIINFIQIKINLN